jgi:Flp pilus assembly pilin Flp
MLRQKRGQSTLEYALIVAVVVVALIAIVNYMGRSMKGRLRASSDNIGKQFDPDNGWQTAWKTEGTGGPTKTLETRNTATGDTTSDIQQSETSENNEYDRYGPSQPGFHNFP